VSHLFQVAFGMFMVVSVLSGDSLRWSMDGHWLYVFMGAVISVVTVDFLIAVSMIHLLAYHIWLWKHGITTFEHIMMLKAQE
jgi:hypothetical protein